MGEDYLTTPDIAALAGVRPVTVRAWRSRHGDYPLPVATYAGVPVWERGAITSWLRRHHKLVGEA